MEEGEFEGEKSSYRGRSRLKSKSEVSILGFALAQLKREERLVEVPAAPDFGTGILFGSEGGG